MRKTSMRHLLTGCLLVVSLLASACGESTPPEPLVDVADLRSTPIDAPVRAEPTREPGPAATDTGATGEPDGTDTDVSTEPISTEPVAVESGGGDVIGDVDTAPPDETDPAATAETDEPTSVPEDTADAEGAEARAGKRPWKNEDGRWVVTFEMLGSFLYLPEGADPTTITIGHHATGDDPVIPVPSPTSPVPGEDEPPTEEELAREKEEALKKAEGVLSNYLVVHRLEDLPQWVRDLEGQQVEIEGFMVPIEFEDGLVREYVLSRYVSGCCFGLVPAPNELVDVSMVGEEGADYESYLPVVAIGSFHVTDNAQPGYLQGLFRIDATKTRVAPPR